jgi:transcriptional regulator with XRE-family HTH domain
MKPSERAASDYKARVAQRIVEARVKKGWKPRDLRAAIGYVLSPSRLSNYEAGRRGVDSWEAHLLANALGVRASWLLCLDEGQLMLNPEEEKLLRYWRALPENERFETAKHIEVNALKYLKPVPDQQVQHLSARGKGGPAQKKALLALPYPRPKSLLGRIRRLLLCGFFVSPLSRFRFFLSLLFSRAVVLILKPLVLPEVV